MQYIVDVFKLDYTARHPPPVARRPFCICTCRIIYLHECSILWMYLSSITPPATRHLSPVARRPSPSLHLHIQNYILA